MENDLLKTFNNDYFPEIQLKNLNPGGNAVTGIFNVSLVKSKNVKTGFVWKYSYYNVHENKLKVLSSFDLKKLRRMVENRNLDWVVYDISKAHKSYDFNRELCEKIS